MSEPRGPVYLSLPREPLAESFPSDHLFPASPQSPAGPATPRPEAIEQAARLLAEAKAPLILCQRSDPSGASAEALAALAEQFAIPVLEPFTIRNVLPSGYPMLLGYDVRDELAEADVVLVVDSGVPWIEKLHRPKHARAVISLGPDPLFQRMPVRSHQTDLSLAGDLEATLRLLHESLARLGVPGTDARRKAIAARSAARHAGQAGAEPGDASGAAAWAGRCLRRLARNSMIAIDFVSPVSATAPISSPIRSPAIRSQRRCGCLS
jgi:acetolactate synthase-1/2/3 large subunit